MNSNTHPSPTIILTRPQMGENIGAAARAMLNFGLTDLRLVAPRDGWPNEIATRNAAGAFDDMPPVQVFDTLAGALHNIQYVYATTARAQRELNKPVVTLTDAAQNARARTTSNQRTAFVFGAERTGLTNDELAVCHEIVHVPTNPAFSSLNLGQAVLVIAYALHNAVPQSTNNNKNSDIAENKDQEYLITRLEHELDQRRFFKTPEIRPTMMRNIRTMILRAHLSTQEIATFQGIISALIGNKSGKG